MPRGIVLPFSADLRQWGKAVRSMGKDLGDIGDDFKDLERVSDRAADDIERSFEDSADDIERAFEGLGREAEAEFDRMGRSAHDGARDIERGFRSTAAGVIAAEAADEFVESWGEAVRSGNLSDALYETITNAGQIMAAAIPGIGTVVGMGIATVGGIVQGINEENLRIREAIRNALTSAGDKTVEDQGYTTGRQYIKGLNKALSDEAAKRATLQDYYGTDSFIEALTMAQGEAQGIAGGFVTIEGLVAGTTKETNKAISALEDQRDFLNNEITAAYDAAGGTQNNMTVAQQEQLVNLTEQRDKINDLITVGQGRVDQINADAATMDQINTSTEAAKKKTDTWAGSLEKAAARAGATKTNVATIPDPIMHNLTSSLAAAETSARNVRNDISNLPRTVQVRVQAKLDRIDRELQP